MAREGRKTTFWNLIDIVIELEEEKSDKAEVFLKILMEYFFKQECEEKKFFSFMKGFELPKLFSEADSIAGIDAQAFELTGDPELLVARHRRAGALLPIAQRRIEDHQTIFHDSSSGFVQGRRRARRQSAVT